MRALDEGKHEAILARRIRYSMAVLRRQGHCCFLCCCWYALRLPFRDHSIDGPFDLPFGIARFQFLLLPDGGHGIVHTQDLMIARYDLPRSPGAGVVMGHPQSLKFEFADGKKTVVRLAFCVPAIREINNFCMFMARFTR